MKATIEIQMVLPGVPDQTDGCVSRLIDLIEARKGVDKVHVRTGEQDAEETLCVHFDPQQISLGEIRQFAQQAGGKLAQQYGHLLLKTNPIHPRKARLIQEQLENIDGILEAGVSADGVFRVEYDRRHSSAAVIRQAIEELGIDVISDLKPDASPDSSSAADLSRSTAAATPESKPLTPMGAQPTAPHDSKSDAIQDRSDHDHDHASAENHPSHYHPSHDDHSHDDHSHAADGNAAHVHGHQHGGILGEKTELIFAILGGVCLLIGWLLGFVESVSGWIPWAMFLAAYFFGGYYIVREAIEKILLGRFEIDFLMIVAAIGAAALGAWAEGALLLFLFAIGHALEHYAMGKARKAIEALSDLAPDTAIVRRNGNQTEVPVEQLKLGDIVVVKTNERIAADGFVVKGQSSVNQAPITGESVPVDKRPVDDPQEAANNPAKIGSAHRVFAGTINESGSLEIQVTQLASESTLARVVNMVSEAETQQSPTQQFTDKFEAFFVPAVIVIVILLLFAFLVVDETFSESFYRAMAVLVAASPCALAIATPSAVLSGVARAARGGVLIKGGGPLENLGRLTAIAFDKTGTLTEGRPRVTDVVAYKDTSESDLLTTAVAVEQLSDHPLAAAVVRDGTEKLKGAPIPMAENLQSITGRGIQATIDGQTVHVGKDDLFHEAGGSPLPEDLREMLENLEGQGRTTMIVRRGDRYLGLIGLMDTPREAAKTMIATLRDLGIQKMIMISGDNQQVADAVAKEVGIDEAWGDLMPDDKVAAIKKLRAERDVAMVGDGVNDAPAMANATVGIAMGAAGSDVALETADVALMADELSHLPFAVGLSRQTSRIIRQNLWYSLGMVAILVPATILGLRIGFAVLLHEGSTLVVVFNALRLLVYKAPDSKSE